MLPLSDGLRARRFPIVNVSIIVANFAVWLFYELPGQSVSPNPSGDEKQHTRAPLRPEHDPEIGRIPVPQHGERDGDRNDCVADRRQPSPKEKEAKRALPQRL